jgi:hypothetical protein
VVQPAEEEVSQEERTQRVVTVAVMVVAALLAVVFVSSGGASSRERSALAALPTTTVGSRAPGVAVVSTTRAATRATATTARTTTTTTPTTATPTTTTQDPGALPQTDQRPGTSSSAFTNGAQTLWDAVRQDQPELAYPFFFPKSAYLQVKAISDPAGDYQNRLIANFDQDVHSLHGQLGAAATTATFVGLTVPGDQAVWVQPGAESNKLSYWRVYGSTLQYQVAGQTRSFPVTSLISWRGEWYVVHLGAIR